MTRFLSLTVLSFMLGTACAGASETAAKPQTEKPAEQAPATVEPAKTPAKTPDGTAAVPTVEQALQRLAKLDKAAQTLSFDFEQTLYFDDTGLTREVAGNVRFVRPDKIRIEHSKPRPQIVYTDKKTIIIYKPADAQALKTGWKQWLSQQASTLTGIAELGDYSSLAARHEVSVSRGKDGRLALALRPKDNPKSYTLTLYLADKDFFPDAITFAVGKTRFETAIKNVRRNQPIPDDVFVFTQRPGVDLIDLTESRQ